jgi:hypothetical protein
MLAMERGEVDGIVGHELSALRAARPDWLRDGKARIVIQVGFTKSPDIPDTAMAVDLVKDPDDRKVLELLLTRQEHGRPFAQASGGNADLVATFRRPSPRWPGPGVHGRRQHQGRHRAQRRREITALLAKTYADPKPLVERAIAGSGRQAGGRLARGFTVSGCHDHRLSHPQGRSKGPRTEGAATRIRHACRWGQARVVRLAFAERTGRRTIMRQQHPRRLAAVLAILTARFASQARIYALGAAWRTARRARAVTDEACPAVIFDGVSVTRRAVRASQPFANVKLAEFPVRGCGWRCRPVTATLDGKSLPLPNPRRILVFGVPVPALGAAAQHRSRWTGLPRLPPPAAQPDLVIHVGDYHYRENLSGCRSGCAGSRSAMASTLGMRISHASGARCRGAVE